MKLIPDQYNEYNPVVLLMGAVFMLGGGAFLAGLGVSGPAIVWLIRAIPASLAAIGTIIVVTQVRARQKRKT